MSRSYKKTPRCGDTKDKFYKNYSNRLLRRRKLETFQHNSYRRVLEPWSICDYETVGESFEEFWKGVKNQWHEWGYKYHPYPDKKEYYRKWLRWYKSK